MKIIVFILLLAISILSLTNIIGLALSGLAIILGLISFFVFRRIEGLPPKDSRLGIKSMCKSLKKLHVWIWVIVPFLTNIFAVFISKLIMPEYLDYVLSRSSSILSLDKLGALVFQLMILALGEEIAWRAFFHMKSE